MEVVRSLSERVIRPTIITTNHLKEDCLEKQNLKLFKIFSIYSSMMYGHTPESMINLLPDNAFDNFILYSFAANRIP